MREYGYSVTRILPYLRFCPYAGEYGSLKTRILAYFIYSVSSAYRASVFSEISPVPTYFCPFKILLMESSCDSQSLKKNHRSDFGLHQFLF